MTTPNLYFEKSDPETAHPQYIAEDESDKVSDSNRLPKTVTRVTTLGDQAGTLQNYTAQGRTILIPTPSDDPNDPLNWSKAYKCIAIIQTSMSFGTEPAKTAYLYSCAALLQGVSMFAWSPFITKFGKRPVYVFSFILYTATTFGAGACKTWKAQLALRIIAGAAAGAGELLGPVTITDIWHVHERGLAFAVYNAFLSVGVAFGLFIGGFITDDLGWRYLYWVYGSIIGALTLFVVFNFPETTYKRPVLMPVIEGAPRNIDYSQQHTYARRLRFFSGVYTQESMLHIFIRPFVAIAYPAVLWAALVCAGTIGFIVAVTSNVALAYGTGYGFGASQVGLCFIAGIIGSIAGIFVGGSFPDWLSKRLAKRNGGIREPEMRLWAIAPSLISAPLALALFGAGIQNKWHWIVPTIGLGLLNFSVVGGTNIAIVYAVDVYKPIANEAITSILGYKAAIGFVLSFYTNPWIASQGYQNAYGEMAAISAGLLLFFLPLYIWGKRIRVSSMTWRATQYIKWDADRDDVVYEEV
ncbi:hypothetical protein CBS101457_005015 [Exobasidium rhododendri]|nr:hypothetical protein CBS101457_005015 [Exobasidium rhododendri]